MIRKFNAKKPVKICQYIKFAYICIEGMPKSYQRYLKYCNMCERGQQNPRLAAPKHINQNQHKAKHL